MIKIKKEEKCFFMGVVDGFLSLA